MHAVAVLLASLLALLHTQQIELADSEELGEP